MYSELVHGSENDFSINDGASRMKKLGQSRIQENEIFVQSGQERMLEG